MSEECGFALEAARAAIRHQQRAMADQVLAAIAGEDWAAVARLGAATRDLDATADLLQRELVLVIGEQTATFEQARADAGREPATAAARELGVMSVPLVRGIGSLRA